MGKVERKLESRENERKDFGEEAIFVRFSTSIYWTSANARTSERAALFSPTTSDWYLVFALYTTSPYWFLQDLLMPQ
jgi:hypothetical protein